MLMTVFIFLARPDWCVKLGTNVNFECTKSLDPLYPVEYMRSGLPNLSASTKVAVCIVCMTIINIFNLIKIKFTVSSPTKKFSFYITLTFNIFYMFVFYMESFNFGRIPFSSVLPVLFVIFSISSIFRILERFLKILYLSKEIIYFFLLFIFLCAVISRIIFCNIPDYIDVEDDKMFNMNFTNFQNSLYTSLVSNLGLGNFGDGVIMLYHEYKIYVIYWFVIGFLIKFMTINFLCGMLAYYHDELFAKSADYIEEYQGLKIMLKENIAKGKMTPSLIDTLIKMYSS